MSQQVHDAVGEARRRIAMHDVDGGRVDDQVVLGRPMGDFAGDLEFGQFLDAADAFDACPGPPLVPAPELAL